jgi:TonB family protein
LNNQVVMQEDRSLKEVVVSQKKVNSTRSRTSTMVLEEPEPVDGWTNYDAYLANNLNVPENWRSKQTEGSGAVTLSFEVNSKGQPVNISVEKSLCESCDREAIRLIKEGPKWKRKSRKGRTTVTVTF